MVRSAAASELTGKNENRLGDPAGFFHYNLCLKKDLAENLSLECLKEGKKGYKDKRGSTSVSEASSSSSFPSTRREKRGKEGIPTHFCLLQSGPLVHQVGQ